MGSFLAAVRSFTRVTRAGAAVADVQVSAPDGLTPEHMAPAGTDSAPLETDTVLCVPVDGSGRYVAPAYADPVNAGLSGPGEWGGYSRDAGAAVQARLRLRDDGAIELSNGAGSLSLAADGAFSVSNAAGSLEIAADGLVTINGVQITTLGDVESLLGVSLNFHMHPVTSAPGTTGAPIPT